MIVKEDIARPCKKKLLTFCQFNRTRVGVRTIRRDIGKFGMQPLTSYQVNRNGVRRQAIRRGTAEAAGINHSQTVKSTRPEQKESMT